MTNFYMPQANQPYVARSGNSYTSTANNIVTGVVGLDIADVFDLGGVLVEPSNGVDSFGGLATSANFGLFKSEGNLYRAIGNPVGANAADATDDILGGIALDAGVFDIAGRGLQITAQGTTGATTNNKRFKVFINPTMTGQTVTNGVISGGHVTAGTPVVDSGAWVNGTTANNATGWEALVQFFKYGAAGSNTQFVQGSPVLGTLHGGIQAGQFLTANESAIINIVVTGSSYTSSAANDVLLQLLEVNAMN